MHSLFDSFINKLRGLIDHNLISENWVSARGLSSLDMKAVTLIEKMIMSSMRYRLIVPTPLSFLEELLFFIYGETRNDESV